MLGALAALLLLEIAIECHSSNFSQGEVLDESNVARIDLSATTLPYLTGGQ